MPKEVFTTKPGVSVPRVVTWCARSLFADCGMTVEVFVDRTALPAPIAKLKCTDNKGNVTNVEVPLTAWHTAIRLAQAYCKLDG